MTAKIDQLNNTRGCLNYFRPQGLLFGSQLILLFHARDLVAIGIETNYFMAYRSGTSVLLLVSEVKNAITEGTSAIVGHIGGRRKNAS